MPKNNSKRAELLKDLEEANEEIILLYHKGYIDENYMGVDTTGLAKTRRNWDSDRSFDWYGREYTSVAGYDSVQNLLPKTEKDGWITRYFARKLIAKAVQNKVRSIDLEEYEVEKFLHSIPQMLFISLPFAAFFLLLLYIRRRKQFNYAAHGIFIMHVYVAIFILSLLVYFFNLLRDKFDCALFGWLMALVILGMLFYEYKAMRKFYGQGRFKTLIKWWVFNTLLVVLLLALATILLVISFL